MKFLLAATLILCSTVSMACGWPGAQDRAFYDRAVTASAAGATWWSGNAEAFALAIIERRRAALYAPLANRRDWTQEEKSLWDELMVASMTGSARDSELQPWKTPTSLAQIAHDNALQAMQRRQAIFGCSP